MNKLSFRSFMVKKGDTYRTIASALGVSVQTVCNKVNENGTEFTQGEISLLKNRWNLTPEQTDDIFFAD